MDGIRAGCRCVALVVVIVTRVAGAGTVTWTGATDGTLSDGTNWSTGAKPGAGDVLVFPATAAARMLTNDLPGKPVFAALQVDGDGYMFTGKTLRIAGGITFTAPATGPVIALPLVFSAAVTTVTNDGAQATFAATSDLSIDNVTLTFTGSGITSVSAPIHGAGALVKLGAGRVDLAGANTYTGTTTISAGSVRMQSTDALGDPTTGTRVDGSGMLLLRIPGASTVAEPFVLAPANLIGGPLFAMLGTPTLTGAITLETDSRIGCAVDCDLAGPISGAGALAISGTHLVLSGTNTFAGGITVQGGEAYLASPASASTGPLLTWNNATFDVGPGTFTNSATLAGMGPGFPNGALRAASTTTWAGPVTLSTVDSTLLINGTLTITGGVSGAGTLRVRGAGNVVLASSAVHTGGTWIQTGELTCTTASCLPDGDPVVIDGAFSLADGLAETIGSIKNTDGSMSLTLGAGSELIAGADGTSCELPAATHGSGALTLVGAGDKWIWGVHEATGPTHLVGGRTRVSGTMLSPIAVDSTASLLVDGGTVGTISSAGMVEVSVADGHAASLAFAPSATLHLTLNSDDPLDRSTLTVDDGVSLGDAALVLAFGFAPSAGASYVLVDHGGAQPVVDAFGVAPAGVSTAGGDGNDIVWASTPVVIDAGVDAALDASLDAEVDAAPPDSVAPTDADGDAGNDSPSPVDSPAGCGCQGGHRPGPLALIVAMLLRRRRRAARPSG